MNIDTETISLEQYGHVLLKEINTLIQNGIIPLIYADRGNDDLYPEHITQIARIKRFLELWCADANVRQSVLNGEPVNHNFGFEIDYEEIRSLWDENAPLVMPPLSVLKYKAFNLEKLTHRNKMRANYSSSDKRYNIWRTRQMNRGTFQLRSLIANSIVHAPYCIELSQGCSVGCWFCGISAPKLEDIFLFTPENRQLYEEVLLSLKKLFGDAVKKGFCYWATDPMDNEDYEKFLVEFHRITGEFPQTTTALALKDIARTRSLLETSKRLGGRLDRFSLLSLKQLHQVHAEFTAEELLFVELITQNKEAYSAKSNAGRAGEGAAKRATSLKPNEQGNMVSAGTIACVSGFLISMVEKKVKLISPCEANEQWPLGYIVFQEEPFTTGQEFDEAITRMVERHMTTSLAESQLVSFHKDLTFVLHEDGFSVKSKYIEKSFRANELYRDMGGLIDEGAHTAGEIELILGSKKLYSAGEIIYVLNTLFREGILNEEVSVYG